jgi:hypothetical protein
VIAAADPFFPCSNIPFDVWDVIVGSAAVKLSNPCAQRPERGVPEYGDDVKTACFILANNFLQKTANIFSQCHRALR